MATSIETPVGSAPVIPVILISAGMYLAWFGVHYFGSDQGKWPTTPVKAVLTGKPIPQPSGQLTVTQIDAQVASHGTGTSTGGTGGGGTPPSQPGGKFGFAQLEQLWTSQGGDPNAAPIAAAVAMAESGGNPAASNQNSNGSVDRGLWQINSVWGAMSTFDVAGNTHAAIMISKNGSDWTPWVTFNTGAYKRFLPSGGGPK